jgi:hypothetical protein
MWTDIAISTGLAILTIAMGYLGVHLTMHPAESARERLWYKAGFCVSAALMVALVVWQGIRNATGQASTQHRAIGTPTKFKIPATMAQVFAVNGRAEFNVDYQNVGLSNSERTGATGDVLVTDTKPDLDRVFLSLAQQFKSGWTGEVLVPQDHRFITANSRNLSRDEIIKLDRGKIGLYLVALVAFSDSTGDYHQEFCGWLQLPLSSRQLTWHGCGIHDSEKHLMTPTH